MCEQVLNHRLMKLKQVKKFTDIFIKRKCKIAVTWSVNFRPTDPTRDVQHRRDLGKRISSLQFRQTLYPIVLLNEIHFTKATPNILISTHLCSILNLYASFTQYAWTVRFTWDLFLGLVASASLLYTLLSSVSSLIHSITAQSIQFPLWPRVKM